MGEHYWAFYKTKEKALKSMRGHRDDIDAPKGKYQWRVVKILGRDRPFGDRYLGW